MHGRGRTIGRFGRGGISAALAVGLVAGSAAAAMPLRLAVWLVPGAVQPPVGNAPPASGDPLEDPAVERIIGDLERATAPRRAIDPVTPPTAVPARPGVPLPGVRPLDRGSAQGGALREGTILPARRGRMTRSEAGEWVFHFDNDANGRNEPPMALLECRTLMQMEEQALRGGEAVVLTITGQVFEYHGRNYLMPTLLHPTRRTDEVIPLQ